MPTPNKEKETKEEFIKRCIPIVIEEGAAEDGEQARAVCESYWEEGENNMNRSNIQNFSPFRREKNKGYEVKNQSGDTVDFYLYDIIDWLGADPQQFMQDLKEVSANQTIRVRINSPGGSVFDGTALYNGLKQHEAKVETYIDGVAASIASVIAMAGDEIHIAENAYMMIHEPFSLVVGTAADMRKEADLLDKVGDTIVDTYAKRSGKNKNEIKQALQEETWLVGQEAIDFGLADYLAEESNAENRFDLSVFNNVPESLINSSDGGTPTTRDLEKQLRDAGLGRKQAKAFVSEGKKTLQSEDVPDDDWAAVKKLINNIRR